MTPEEKRKIEVAYARSHDWFGNRQSRKEVRGNLMTYAGVLRDFTRLRNLVLYGEDREDSARIEVDALLAALPKPERRVSTRRALDNYVMETGRRLDKNLVLSEKIEKTRLNQRSTLNTGRRIGLDRRKASK